MKYSVNDYFSGTEEEKNKNISVPLSSIGDVSKLIYDKIKSKSSNEFNKPTSIKLILHALIQKDNVTQLDIVKSTRLKPPTVSITLKKMENEGLVTRTPDPYDLRAVRVTITDKGREMYMISVRSVFDMEEKIMKDISPAEIDSFMKILGKIKNNLEAIE